MKLFIIAVFQIALITPAFSQSYLKIPPVKLLTVGSIANRCPAAGSVENGGYRTSIENGFVRVNFSTIKVKSNRITIQKK